MIWPQLSAERINKPICQMDIYIFTDINFQQSPFNQGTVQSELYFSSRSCSLLFTDRLHICIFCGGVGRVKIMNFE